MERKILFGDFINRKIASLDHKNFDLYLAKSKNVHFNQWVSPLFWSKFWCFFLFLFLGKIDREIVFGDFLDRNIALFDCKKNNLGKSQNMHFSKGIRPWALVKILFLGKIKRKTVFGKYLERKITFLDPKTIDLGKSQNMHFLIRGYSLVLMKIFNFFSLSLFRQIRARNSVWWLSWQKIAFLDHKGIYLGKSQNWPFS